MLTRMSPRLRFEGGRRRRVEDLHHFLHLQIMVTGAQGAHLVALAFLGMFRDGRGVCPGHAAALFDTLQVCAVTVSLFHRPLGAAGEHRSHLILRQPDVAGAAEPRGNHLEQTVGQALPVGIDGVSDESGVE